MKKNFLHFRIRFQWEGDQMSIGIARFESEKSDPRLNNEGEELGVFSCNEKEWPALKAALLEAIEGAYKNSYDQYVHECVFTKEPVLVKGQGGYTTNGGIITLIQKPKEALIR